MSGKSWLKQMFMSAFLVPSMVCGTAFLINFIAIYYHASRAIPFGTMVRNDLVIFIYCCLFMFSLLYPASASVFMFRLLYPVSMFRLLYLYLCSDCCILYLCLNCCILYLYHYLDCCILYLYYSVSVFIFRLLYPVSILFCICIYV